MNIIKEYIEYISKSKGRHGTHSPFIYQFVSECLTTNIDKKFLSERKNLFKNIKRSNITIQIKDFGVGSKKLKNTRKLKDIFKIGSSNGKYGLLLYKLNKYYLFNNVLELGTSLGVGSFHLSSGNPKSFITSVEGCKETFLQAKEILKYQTNVKIVNNTFENFIKSEQHIVYDMVFIDGHHDGKALLNYIEILDQHTHDETLFILDDIRWSNSMFQSWNELINSTKFNVTIDFFRMGVITKRPKQQKEHFIIKL